jgi:hypothetical protein
MNETNIRDDNYNTVQNAKDSNGQVYRRLEVLAQEIIRLQKENLRLTTELAKAYNYPDRRFVEIKQTIQNCMDALENL